MSNSGGENGRQPHQNSMASALSYVFQFLNPSKDSDHSGNGHAGDVESSLSDVVVPDLRFASHVTAAAVDVSPASWGKTQAMPSRVVVLFARKRNVSSVLLTRHDRGWWMPFLPAKPEESNLDAAIRLHKMVWTVLYRFCLRLIDWLLWTFVCLNLFSLEWVIIFFNQYFEQMFFLLIYPFPSRHGQVRNKYNVFGKFFFPNQR